ncbi:MAG TPA: F0F1 ATP synthase subunit gamma [Planctomycetota bacterium]|nr:F0F1 ATP synthase subunit gamma [Planctomycetota bacterium]
MEALKRKIKSAHGLQSVVRTMKALAAVSIAQYERAVESLADYDRTVRLGLQALLRERPPALPAGRKRPEERRIGALVFGSDQGMCGQLNEQIVAHAAAELAATGLPAERRTAWIVGERAAARLADEGQPVLDVFPVPSSVAGITPAVQTALLRLERAHREQGLDEVALYYCRHESGALFRPETLHFLPVDLASFQDLEARPWPTDNLPVSTMDRDRLFSALIRQYLFVSLYRAFAESLASENASRLASMQNAEKNIDERLTALTRQYHQVRQSTITSELLDIVAGFEALRDA